MHLCQPAVCGLGACSECTRGEKIETRRDGLSIWVGSSAASDQKHELVDTLLCCAKKSWWRMQAECAAHNHSEVVSVPEAYKVQIIEPWPWTQMLLAAVLFLRMKRLLTGKHGSCKSLTESTVSLWWKISGYVDSAAWHTSWALNLAPSILAFHGYTAENIVWQRQLEDFVQGTPLCHSFSFHVIQV